MEPLVAAIAIVAVFVALVLWIARTEGLMFLGPDSTRALGASARSFCVKRCRENGTCPLTRSTEAAANCPLFRFVDADVPTVMHGSPFEAVG